MGFKDMLLQRMQVDIVQLTGVLAYLDGKLLQLELLVLHEPAPPRLQCQLPPGTSADLQILGYAVQRVELPPYEQLWLSLGIGRTPAKHMS